MGLVKIGTELTSLNDDKTKFRYIELFNQEVKAILNGSIEILRNIEGKVQTLVILEADTDTPVKHRLGHVPLGYLVIGQSADMGIYDGLSGSNGTNIFFRANALGTARVFIF